MTVAQANVVVEGTRVIYPAGQSSVTVQLVNQGKNPALVQSWVDSGDANTSPEASTAPFVVLPPISRVNAGNGQALRLMFTGAPGALPAEHESVFWLNVLDVPPHKKTSADQNYIQFAIRSRIKIFYRPDGLPGDANKAPRALRWQLDRADGHAVLVVDNPTAYHVSLVRVALSENGTNLLPKADMIAPGGHARWPLTQAQVRALDTVYFSAINDYGAARTYDSTVDPGRVTGR